MHTYKYFVAPALLFLGVAAFLAFFVPEKAIANPFYTGTKALTAAATSTQAFLTPGTATTTPIYDSYEQNGTNQTNSGNLTIPDSLAIVLDGVASSTSAVLSTQCEFSDNRTDWYQNEIYTGTTTNQVNIGTPVSFSFTYASTTVGGGAVLAASNRIQKVFECPVPLRYARAVVSVTGANASIWVALIPKKQRNSGN